MNNQEKNDHPIERREVLKRMLLGASAVGIAAFASRIGTVEAGTLIANTLPTGTTNPSPSPSPIPAPTRTPKPSPPTPPSPPSPPTRTPRP